MHMNVKDQDEMEISELDFTHGWLIEQKNKEAEELKKARKKGKNG